MKIQSINNTAFKGSIKVVAAEKPIVMDLDTAKMLSVSADKDNKKTCIEYDIPKVVQHNGYKWTEPTMLVVKHDLNTILNAYNAAKDSDLLVDLSN